MNVASLLFIEAPHAMKWFDGPSYGRWQTGPSIANVLKKCESVIEEYQLKSILKYLYDLCECGNSFASYQKCYPKFG